MSARRSTGPRSNESSTGAAASARGAAPHPQSARFFRDLVERTRLIPWEASGDTLDLTYIGPQVTEILGYQPEQCCRPGFWREFLYPEDRDRVLRAYARQTDLELEYRVTAADGRVVWVQAFVHVEREEGATRSFSGFLAEIEARKRVEQGLRDAAQELAVILESLPISIYKAVPPNYRTAAFVSDNIESLTGYPAERFGRDDSFWFDNVHPDDLQQIVLDLPGQMPQGRHGREYRWRTADGTYRWFEDFLHAVEDPGGGPSSLVGILHDITARKAAEEELTRTLERFQDLYENAPGMFVSTDAATGRVIACNETLARKTGRPKDDIIGKPVIELYHPDCRDAARDAWRLFVERGEVFDAEFELLRADGGVIPVSVDASAVRDEEGRPKYSRAVIRDITKQTKAEASTRLMAHELDHRLKNVLATVSSVAQLTLTSSDSVEELGRGFVGRIGAMARIHEALSSRSWHPLEIGTLVELVVSPFTAAGRAIEIEGESLSLPTESERPLGMALHELATNAVKHGSLSVKTGRLTIRWHLEGQGSQRKVRLEWIESEGPKVVKPSRVGFGRRLVEIALPYELRCSVQMDFRPAGLRCAIVFPAPEP